MRAEISTPKSQWLPSSIRFICGALLVECNGSSDSLFESALDGSSSGDCPSGRECSAGT